MTASPDIILGDDGDLPEIPALGAGLEAIEQRVRVRLMTHLGDWPLDTAAGMPYIDWLAQKPPRVQTIGALIKREIEGVEGVSKVTGWRAVQDGDTLSFSATIWTMEGAVDVKLTPFGKDFNVSVGFTLRFRSRGVT